MKLLYVTSIDLPSTRANRLQIVSMSRALHKLLGNRFVLGLRRNAGEPLGFPFVEMPHKRSFFLAWSYLRLARRLGITDIYCREEKLLFFLVVGNMLLFGSRLRLWYEVHHLVYIKTWWHRLILWRARGVVSITVAMREELVRLGYKAQQTLVAPDAVDMTMFGILLSKEDARQALSLPQGPLVIYTGTIDEPWKGAGVLYEAAKLLGDACTVVVVGGKPHYVEEFNRNYPPLARVVMLGHKPHGDIPRYLQAADVLVLPNSAKSEVSRISTSPMKLFEYMASSRPVVASDLPSIREVLNESSAVLVEPDSPEALAQGIHALLADPARGESLARQARQDVGAHTWDNRAHAVLDFISL